MRLYYHDDVGGHSSQEQGSDKIIESLDQLYYWFFHLESQPGFEKLSEESFGE